MQRCNIVLVHHPNQGGRSWLGEGQLYKMGYLLEGRQIMQNGTVPNVQALLLVQPKLL